MGLFSTATGDPTGRAIVGVGEGRVERFALRVIHRTEAIGIRIVRVQRQSRVDVGAGPVGQVGVKVHHAHLRLQARPGHRFVCSRQGACQLNLSKGRVQLSLREEGIADFLHNQDLRWFLLK